MELIFMSIDYGQAVRFVQIRRVIREWQEGLVYNVRRTATYECKRVYGCNSVSIHYTLSKVTGG